ERERERVCGFRRALCECEQRLGQRSETGAWLACPGGRPSRIRRPPRPSGAPGHRGGTDRAGRGDRIRDPSPVCRNRQTGGEKGTAARGASLACPGELAKRVDGRGASCVPGIARDRIEYGN